MAGSRLENDLSESQLQWITLGVGLLLVPATFVMYRHYQSLKARYPSADPMQPQAKPKLS